jgi:TolB-like protein
MRKNVFYLIFLFIFMIFNENSYSGEKLTVAILDLTAKGVPNIISNAITDVIRSEFVNIGNFTVVERSQMKAVLEEQGLQMTGCTDSACAVQFGKILSARRIVIGEVNKIGSSILITARYVDVQTGESMFSATDKADSIDSLDTAAIRIAKDLATRIVSGDKMIIIPKSVNGYYTRSIVPGWGQFYAENKMKGYIYSGLFGLSCLSSGYFVYDFFAKKSDYDGLDKRTSRSDFKDARDKYDSAALMANISFGVIGLVYIAHWADVIFFTRSDFDKLFAVDVNKSNFFISNSNCSRANEPDFTLGYSYKF